ncbi:DUF4299 domain-containing protein [Streptococcus sp. CSL10205-OR2]|uniref:DUF4299 domain-containing protein n=1 Tax=Streptococcus sp. CSL10205-OR2 TaxID=2980558 RepID=UPI0021D84091|nr:DUF4299 domain-containing protein [Streptococcus sp. CSL10205-OR2]MCU9533521.1 DUF4299 domain-containing protein [Streptococcus sp. CSL10205-OR2]
MTVTIFNIASQKELRIADIIATTDLFECFSVTLKTANQKMDETSLISDYERVLFGVRNKSVFGFYISYQKESYQVKVPSLATPSDWTGALMVIKLIAALTDGVISDEQGNTYTAEQITQYSFTDHIIDHLSQLYLELQKTSEVRQFSGVKRPIFLDSNMLQHYFSTSDERFFDTYEKLLMVTQYVTDYQSKQHVYRIESGETTHFIGTNFLNVDKPTVLSFVPSLEPELLKQYNDKEITDWRLFAKTDDNKVIAEVDYQDFFNQLPEGQYFMIDAKYALVQPLGQDYFQKNK